MSIRIQLLAGILIALLFPAVAGMLALRQLEQGMRDTIGENTIAAAGSLIAQIEDRVYLVVDTVRELALATPEIGAALEESNNRFAVLGGEAAIESLLERRDSEWRAWVADPAGEPPGALAQAEASPISEVLRRSVDFWRTASGEPIFAEIFVTNRYGANVAQTGPTSDYRQADEAWWQAAFDEGLWLGEVGFDDSSGVFSLDIVARVDRGGEPVGVLKAVLDIQEIHSILEDYEISAALLGGTAELWDSQGAMLYPEYVDGTTAAARRSGATAAPQDGYWIEKGTAASADVLVAAVQGRGRSGLRDLGWTARVRFPGDAIFASGEKLNNRLVTIGVVSLLLALTIAVLVAFGVSRPIRSAVVVADRLAEGDLTRKVSTTGSGEVRELLEAMSTMVDNVRRTVTAIVVSSERLSTISDGISLMGEQISAGASHQKTASENGRSSVRQMASSIETVAGSTKRVSVEVEKTSSSVEEMSVTNEATSRNLGELASGVGQTLATMQEFARSIDQIASAAATAGGSSESAVREARGAGEVVCRAADSVTQISATMEEIAGVNQSLAGNSERINYITEVIDEIARKTKLLALNANIQASSAGEHGRAFRVIAADVRELAERSGSSAKEIAELIEEVQDTIREAESISQVGAVRAQEGLELAGRAGQALERVVGSIQQVRDRIVEISGGTGEQATASEQLVRTFERMSEMTDEVAAATRQQRLGGEQIMQAMGHLRTITDGVTAAVDRHGDDGRLVTESIESIAKISEDNVESAAEIVHITEDLKDEAATLRALGEFFALTEAPGAGDSRVDPPASANSRRRWSGRLLQSLRHE
ncbi:MAG: methyl-accepting chemotaxis protein [Thermoanaerobaculia bacterium]